MEDTVVLLWCLPPVLDGDLMLFPSNFHHILANAVDVPLCWKRACFFISYVCGLQAESKTSLFSFLERMELYVV